MVLGGTLVFLLFSAPGRIPFPGLPWQTWVAGLSFITVGTLDDRYSFHPRQKFLVLLSISAMAAWPWVLTLKATSPSWLPQALVGSPLSLVPTALLITFWFMAVPNAVNIEDAINGYMGGFTFLLLFALYLRGVDTRIALGALAGFLLLNWPRAKHFMGDAGSFGCGFFIAEGILRGGGIEHPLMPLAFTAPISMDVAMGLIRRKKLGMSFFTADRATCPHHLLARFGGSHMKAALVLWLISSGFVVLCPFPIAVLFFSLGFACVLVYLNANSLFLHQSSGT